MKEQHVDLIISVDGSDRVAFVTKFGWASKMSMRLDMCNIDDAKKAATDFIKDLELVPAFNDPGCEDYVNQAVESIIPKVLGKIPKLETKHPSSIAGNILSLYTLKVVVKLVKTYEVVVD